MRQFQRPMIVLSSILGLGSFTAMAQVFHSEDFSLPRYNSAEGLAKYGIGTDRPSLHNALNSNVPVVRSMAASRIAIRGFKDEIPYVLLALKSEKDKQTYVSIAQSLLRLGSPSGVEALTGVCASVGTPSPLLLVATQDLITYHHGEALKSCVPTLLLMAESDPSPVSRANSLYQLSYMDPSVLASQESRLIRLAIAGVNSDSVTMKSAAARTLGQYPTPEGNAALQFAIQREPSGSLRDFMSAKLKTSSKFNP